MSRVVHGCPPQLMSKRMSNQDLVLRAIPIVTEAAWNEEGRSFYFRDPDNNLLEIANADFWPR